MYQIQKHLDQFPQLSDIQIKLIRIGSVIGMIVMTLIIIVVAINTFAPEPPLPASDVLNLE